MDRWISRTFTPSGSSLPLFRILYALGSLFIWHTVSAVPLGELPDEWYFPPAGPFALLDGYPAPGLLAGMEFASKAALVFVLLGYRTRLASWVVGLTQLFDSGIRFSTGKVDHDFLLVVLPIVMSFSSWGDELSLDAFARRAPLKDRLETDSTVLAYLALLVAMTFGTSGIMKALTGWADPSASATRGYVVVYLNQYSWASHEFNRWLAQLDSPTFWKGLDYLTLVFETGALFAVWRRGWFEAFLLVAVVFHIGTVVLLNIDFSRLVLVYAAFANLRPAPSLRRGIEWILRGFAKLPFP